MKYLVVTGGVVSGLGKGISISSMGVMLKACGLRVTAIKIDRAFVNGVIDHPEDRAVIAAMVGMAGALDLEVVGEGVETEDQLMALRTIGCDKVQGYLIARPLAPADVRPWIDAKGRGWRAPVASGAR